jgi:hypothetical protein
MADRRKQKRKKVTKAQRSGRVELSQRRRRTKVPKKAARSRKKKRILKKIVKYQAFLAGVFLAMYLAIGFWLGPGAIKQDVQGKVAGASTVLSIHIAGPPVKPVVTATPGCDSESPYVQLSWDETNDTDNYDIDRDSASLITGITSTSYNDTSVATETTYTYQVTANGPLGNTTSDEVSATTGDCYVPPVPAACSIVTMGDTDLTGYSGIPETTDRTPTFTGTTNIPFANMRFEIFSGPLLIGTSTANLNGYWSFTVPQKLDHGLHTIYVTATDPADSTRYSTTSQNFRVSEEEEKSSTSTKKKKKSTSATVPSTQVTTQVTTQTTPSAIIPGEEVAPLNLKIEVINKDKVVYAGSDLNTNLTVVDIQNSDPKRSLVKYKIIDSRGNSVFEKEAEHELAPGKVIPKSISLPVYLKSGSYIVRAETQFNDYFVSAEEDFIFKEKPILNLGGGMIVTYPSIISTMSTIAILLILILALFLVMLAREYWLAGRASILIDEDELVKDGFIS